MRYCESLPLEVPLDSLTRRLPPPSFLPPLTLTLSGCQNQSVTVPPFLLTPSCSAGEGEPPIYFPSSPIRPPPFPFPLVLFFKVFLPVLLPVLAPPRWLGQWRGRRSWGDSGPRRRKNGALGLRHSRYRNFFPLALFSLENGCNHTFGCADTQKK